MSFSRSQSWQQADPWSEPGQYDSNTRFTFQIADDYLQVNDVRSEKSSCQLVLSVATI